MYIPPFILWLDFDGVLMHGWHINPLYRRDWAKNIKQDLGLERAQLQKEIFEHPDYQGVQLGTRDIVDFLDAALPRMGYQGTTQSFIDYWLLHDGQPENLNHELIAQVQNLRTRHHIPVYVVTIQNSLRRAYLHDVLQIDQWVDGAFYAADFDFMKDDPRLYKALRTKLDPTHQTPILFFDDRPPFVTAAQAAGAEAAIFNTLNDFITHPWIRELAVKG